MYRHRPKRLVIARKKHRVYFMDALVYAKLSNQVIVKGLRGFIKRYRKNTYRHIKEFNVQINKVLGMYKKYYSFIFTYMQVLFPIYVFTGNT